MDAGRFFGRGIGFPPRVGPDGRVSWSEGEQNVRESIRIILSTEPKERPMLPDFGAGLGVFLFEPNVPSTWQSIRDRITRALAEWEPRVVVESVEIAADPDDPQAAIANITYRLVANQGRERVAISVTVAG